MLAWPSLTCASFGVSPKPPALTLLMHHDAKKWRRQCIPGYFALPFGLTTRAATHAAVSPFLITLRCIGLLIVEGNTSPSSLPPFSSFHSLSACAARGVSGILRPLLCRDLGKPISPYSSARWFT